MMKIGMFTNSYKPINDSGVVNTIDSLQFGLKKLKQKVYIFAPAFPNYKDKQSGVYRYPSVNLSLKVKYPIAIPYSFNISRIIKKLELDIIHSHHPFNLGRKGANFASKYGTPLVFTNHTRYEDYSHYVPFNQFLTKKIIRKLVKNYINLCDCVIAPTINTKEYLLSLGVKSRIEIIPNAVNSKFLKKEKSPDIKKLHQLENKKILLFVGRLAKEKNIPFIIKSFKLLSKKRRDVVLIIAGGGYEESNLKSLIKELKLQNKIIMTGNVPHSKVANYYSVADLFITGSITEVNPLTLLESLACGLPIIALSKSNLQDIIKNGENGFLTDESIKSFSKRIDELLSNENMLKKLRKNAKISSKSYDVKIVSRRLLHLYKSLI